MSGSGFIWNPPPELIDRANVTRLRRALGAADYHELHRISIEEPDRFWPAVVDDLGLEFSQRWDTVVDSSRGPEWSTWFNGGRLNLARICVHRWASDEEALVGLYEDGSRESAELRRDVTPGDAARRAPRRARRAGGRPRRDLHADVPRGRRRVARVRAHRRRAGADLLGLRGPAVATRLEDSQAKVVICADWSLRRGKRIEMTETLVEAETHAVEFVIEWNRETRTWPDAVTRQPGVLPPLEVDSEAPYLLAYTSGTTGRPKGALHVQGGFLVSIARETAYQLDVNQGDRIHFATDMGWIMGPWTVVGGGAVGATIVFAEGAPDWPDDRLWRLVESEQVTMLGLSPTLARALIPKGEPRANLSSLRAFCTTGEPWNPDPYMWLFDRVGGARVPIVNISGGTEVGACFLTTVLTEPIKPVALGFPALGPGHGRRRLARLQGAHGPGRRARLPEAVAGHDARDLARQQALPRDVLAALSRRLDARRLGVDRRGRLLVPARPLRRHAQHRGQADRAGRARVGGDLVRHRGRGGGSRRAACGEGRGGVDLLRA